MVELTEQDELAEQQADALAENAAIAYYKAIEKVALQTDLKLDQKARVAALRARSSQILLSTDDHVSMIAAMERLAEGLDVVIRALSVEFMNRRLAGDVGDKELRGQALIDHLKAILERASS